MRRRRVVIAWFGVLAMLTAACTTGDGGTPDAETAGGAQEGSAGGLPETAEPQEVRQGTHEMLEGKTVRAVMLTDEGFAVVSEWVKSMQYGFEAAGMDFKVASAGFDQQVLAQQMETFVNERPDVLVVHNQDLSTLASLIQRAQEEGTYVIVIYLGSTAQSDAYVGPDWVTAGETLGERVADDCLEGDSKKVAIIVGTGSDLSSVLAGGAMEGVLKDRGLEVVAKQAGQFDPSKVRDVASTILRQHPDLCAFTGIWDVQMHGAVTAVEQAGRSGEVSVYATDNSQTTCDMIGKGKMTAAASLHTEDVGPNIVAVARYLLQSGYEPGAARTAIYTRTSIIDKTNADLPGACYDGTVIE